MKAKEKKTVKLCYEHIGGKLGHLLLEQFLDQGWLAKDNDTDKDCYITEKGKLEFAKIGIDLSHMPS